MTHRLQLLESGVLSPATLTSQGEILRAKWKSDIKRRPPAVRWHWLGSREAIVALGAKTAADLRRQLARRAQKLAAGVCSASWADAWSTVGELPPSLTFKTDTALLQQTATPRRHGVELVLSHAKVRDGNTDSGPYDLPTAGPGSRRWTPPQVVELEDELDSLSVEMAGTYDYPTSPSAAMIERIRMRHGREREKFGVRDRIVELAQGDADRRIQSHGRQAMRGE